MMMQPQQRTLTEMKKKKKASPLLLLAMVGLMLATLLLSAYYPSLAFAAQQGWVMATGVLVGPVEDGDQDPTPKYTLTDEATDTNYVLISGFVELEPFAGQRVTITGVPIGGADNAPPALNVTQKSQPRRTKILLLARARRPRSPLSLRSRASLPRRPSSWASRRPRA